MQLPVYKFIVMFLVSLCLFFGTSAKAASPGESNALQVLNNAVIKNDPGAKIVSLTFEKQKDTKYQEVYSASIKIKSCYKTKVECSATGTDAAISSHYGFFFNSIEKGGTSEATSVVKIHKDDAGQVERFVVTLTCDPIYSEHPNHPPNHPYWKQFLPKGNTCQ